MLAHLWEHVDRAGRDRSEIDVAFSTGLPGAGSEGFDPAADLEALERMAAIGVTWNGTGFPDVSIDATVEAIERYGAEVIGEAG